MDKILVPVDFSPHTATSCKFAVDIAKKTGAGIILFHSFFDQIYFSDGGFSTGFESGIMLTDQIILDLYNQKENYLKKLAEEISSDLAKSGDTRVKVDIRLESGDPEVQIMNVIRQLNPDIIVMGSSGMGRKGLFAGSVARRIMGNTELPVIAIPEPEQTGNLRNVAYMTNFNPDDHLVIAGLDNLFAPYQLTVHCLHLGKERDLKQNCGKMDDLKNRSEIRSLEGRIFFHVLRAGDITETLEQFISENDIDLIAFIPHKRNIFKNLLYQGLSKEDLFNTRKPVMAIQPPRQT